MSEHGDDIQGGTEEAQAAAQAAQNVVENVTSYQYSADKETIAAELDEGLAEAGVQVQESEKAQLVDRIDELKSDESQGAPQVRGAEPAS